MIWRTKAFWTRALLCWIVGAVLLHNDETNNFDLRLKIRGPRAASPEIILVDVAERDWAELDPATRNVLRPLKEVVSFSDAFFWNQKAWQRLLEKVLSDSPRAVGVTFYFGENVRSPKLNKFTNPIFYDERIVWGTDVDTSGRILTPLFTNTSGNNVGLRSFRPDEDGSVRRFATSPTILPHLATRVSRLARPELTASFERAFHAGGLINYSGGVLDSSFRVVNARDLLEGRVSKDIFTNKVVLIGSLATPTEQMQTPLGRMSRTEVLANVVDNMTAQKVVKRFDKGYYLVLLVLILCGAIWVLATYPQSVALVVFILAGMMLSAFSAWAFDIANIWIPVLSPLVELTATCIVFLSYQLALNERRTWRLEQQRRYLDEIERLKTNFVSMMSHDLKTPIAKIQAICDRMLASPRDPEITQDLTSLRRSSDELHRYIQSILQISKIEAKDFKITKKVTDINEDIERVVERLEPLAVEKDIVIEVNLEPMFSIEVDTTLIQEVIHNLIENAIKYTPHGGRVTVSSHEKDDFVTVTVEDTGPGIPVEEQKEIWGKFNRGRSHGFQPGTVAAGQSQAPGSVEIKGSGLGLYLVKYFVELHGGHTFLESRKNDEGATAGTRIGFSIPVADEAGETDGTFTNSFESSMNASLSEGLRDASGHGRMARTL